MARSIDRRTFLIAGIAAAALLAAAPGMTSSGDVRGTVTYAGGEVIPEGRLVIATDGDGPVTPALVSSDGKSTEIAFEMPADMPSTGQIVARLERADGWLLARGSASVEAGGAVTIELFEAMY
ncbi:hypothetical protein OCH239_04745 [Roseivivax halodurans JCM 10272]|uniref:Nidogen G2 beta-barrel domain-containing protein n=1 Tax=Roseivivax halodurans JCM 10272 TaxID=1449350 RepID=X7EG02_9RHOB|nr:hypothetical protein [Roseivivax halodurans]ETX14161.1 hypothetical protein OCH239_04745 [Roseivivax halodurans JCM 10272]